MILKCIFVPLVIAFLIYMIGNALTDRIKAFSEYHSFGIGFIVLLGGLQIISLPFMMLDIRLNIYLE